MRGPARPSGDRHPHRTLRAARRGPTPAAQAPPPLDLDAGIVRVVGALAELDGGQLLEDTP
jgi:hypothetical protein